MSDYDGHTSAVTADLDGAPGDDGSRGENDTIAADVENLGGGQGNDTLTGNVAANHIYGNDGDDTVRGGDGRDRIDGNDGADALYGEGGNDDIDGDDAGSPGNDVLYGGTGDDELTVDGGDDRLYGEDGDDHLHSLGTASGDWYLLNGGANGTAYGDFCFGRRQGAGDLVDCEHTSP